ncbi:YsnF/AvaK domain-containing protein [Nostoc sp. NIES-2111]
MTDYSSTGGTAGSGSMQTRTVTAFFDRKADADRAIQALVDEGFDRSRIRMMPGNERDTAAGSATDTDGGNRAFPDRGHSGFWEGLADLFLPDRDRDVYAEGLNRGGVLLAVETTAADHDTAVDILDDEGTIDMDEREDAWRASGWSGRGSDVLTEGSTGMGGFGAGSTAGSDLGVTGTRATSDFGDADVPRTAGMSDSVMPRTTAMGDAGNADDTLSRGSQTSSSGAGFGSGTAGSDRTGLAGSEEVIPVVEENLRVGKRDVNLGRVRVRSYVREVPAEAQVNLREEHVRIERRPVDRPAETSDALFRDRTIDMEEHAEEAVVGKEARVREELVVNRDVAERTQNVSDTVRKTEVEVEDDRARKGTGTFDKDRR